MSAPFGGGGVNWAALQQGAEVLDHSVGLGGGYKLDPATIQAAIRRYKRLLNDMDGDERYAQAIMYVQPPVEDGPSHQQAQALQQFGQEMWQDWQEQREYIKGEIAKLQKTLQHYEQHEEETAEGMRRQMP
jgi:hypothetical protein